MKIVCLIKSSPPTNYFVNAIHRQHPISLVIVERPTPQAKSKLERLKEITKTYGWLFLLGVLLDRSRGRDHTNTHNQFFGDQWRELDPAIPKLHVDSVNGKDCIEQLKAESADLLLDHGTSIVKPPALATAPLALNLHWGLSPYYRGTKCTEWALVNWDPYNIGVTIHKLAQRIDGGDIVYQARATVEPEDDAHAINMQLTKLGTDLTLRAIRELEAGNDLTFHPQDFSAGFVTLSRQTSHHWLKHARLIEKRGLTQLLRTPARKERLPIVEPKPTDS